MENAQPEPFRATVHLVERMPRVCNAVIKAKGSPSIVKRRTPPPNTEENQFRLYDLHDLLLTVGLSQRKAIFPTAWRLFQGHADLHRPACQCHHTTSCSPAGLLRKYQLIPNHLSPSCSSPPSRATVKGGDMGGPSAYLTGKHWGIICVTLSVAIFVKAQINI